MAPDLAPSPFARTVRAALGLVLVLALAGCQGEDPTPDAGIPVETPEEEEAVGQSVLSSEAPVQLEAPVSNLGTQEVTGDTITVEMSESFAYEPTFVRAEPGAAVVVELDNTDNIDHTFTIDEADIDVVVDEQSQDLVDVIAPDSGHLRFYCRFHESQGMVGAIFVE